MIKFKLLQEINFSCPITECEFDVSIINQEFINKELFSKIFSISKNLIVRNAHLHIPLLTKTECYFLWKKEFIWTSFEKKSSIEIKAKNEKCLYDSLIINYGMITGQKIKDCNILDVSGVDIDLSLAIKRNFCNGTVICSNEANRHEFQKVFNKNNTETFLF